MAKKIDTVRKETDISPFSLTEALEEASSKWEAQNTEVRENSYALAALQASLSELEKHKEVAVFDLKTIERKSHICADEMVHLQKQVNDLESQSHSVYMENINLQISIETDEEKFQLLLAEHNTYRNKMESHKTAVSMQESQTAIHKLLFEKRSLVKKLREQKEWLKSELQNPEGRLAKRARTQIHDLKEQIASIKELANDRKYLLAKEVETHSQLKKEIEIQNRRFEAILKRLHCQLNKAQINHRQLTGDICNMEEGAENHKECW